MPSFFTPPVASDPRQLDLPLPGAQAPHAPPSAQEFRLTPPNVIPAPPPAEGVTQRALTLGARKLYYRLKRSARRSIGFVIDSHGLTITAPRWVTLAEIDAAIVEKKRWIFAKLADWQAHVEQRARPRIAWQEGVRVLYVGQPVRVSLGAPRLALQAGSGAHEAGAPRVLALPLPAQAGAQQIQECVQGWLQQEANRIFGERLALYADRLGVRFQSYALSSAATRWGSCSSDKRIRLNWRLIHFPLTVIDYVVAHELAHLREMNHSPRFWQTVESIFPDFRQARSVLKRQPADVEIAMLPPID